MPGSSVGDAFTAVWWRDPAGRWVIFHNVSATQSCPRWFGQALERSELRPIDVTWSGPRTLRVTIEDYLDWHHHTPGVQHLALRTDDELHSIAALRARGVDFLAIPDVYYNQVWERVDRLLTSSGHKPVREDHERIKQLGILVDADDEGYLLQLFTKPLQDRPTLFFEIICRRGSQSFGKGNFKALFEALEMEQGKRGNL